MAALTPFVKNEIQKKEGRDFVDFYNMMDDFFNGNVTGIKGMKADTFKLDVKDQGDSFLVEAEMPGVKKDEIQIEYQDDHLIISVSQTEEVNEEKPNYIHRERRSSSMQRSVFLKDITAEKVDAQLEEGVLKIILPKNQPSEKKQPIKIK
jgi:HSP20 family protein